jgi:hypothetical protein
MNEILLRPIFRAKYIEEQKKNKFNKGGLASIQKFAEGGLSKGERTAITLAPFVQALTGAQTMPGESEASSFARAFGQGLGGLGEAKKSIAAIDQASAPKEQFRILTKEEVASGAYGPLTPGGVYQLNVESKEIKDLSPKQLFADPFQTKMAEKGAEKVIGIQQAGSSALQNASTLEILDAIVKNPDVTMGQFGPLAERAGKLFEGLGFGEKNFTDVTGTEILRKFAGQKVLKDLGQLKGALSEKELAFIQSLNINESMPREAAILTIQLYKKANDIAALKAKITNDHLANFGNPQTRDTTGKTLDQKLFDVEANNPILTPEIENRLSGLTKSASQSKKPGKFDRNIVVVNQQTLDQYKKLFPNQDIKIGDRFEVREKKIQNKIVKDLIKIK